MASQSRSAYVNNYMFLFFNHEECEMNFVKFAALALVLGAFVAPVMAGEHTAAAVDEIVASTDAMEASKDAMEASKDASAAAADESAKPATPTAK